MDLAIYMVARPGKSAGMQGVSWRAGSKHLYELNHTLDVWVAHSHQRGELRVPPTLTNEPSAMQNSSLPIRLPNKVAHTWFPGNRG